MERKGYDGLTRVLFESVSVELYSHPLSWASSVWLDNLLLHYLIRWSFDFFMHTWGHKCKLHVPQEGRTSFHLFEMKWGLHGVRVACHIWRRDFPCGLATNPNDMNLCVNHVSINPIQVVALQVMNNHPQILREVVCLKHCYWRW